MQSVTLSSDCGSVVSDISREIALREITAITPAGAGELVQGQLHTGEDFLVTNPVSCFSTIRVNVSHGSGRVSVSPTCCTKVRTAVKRTLRFFGVTNRDVRVTITSAIPIGKGMASSTADIVGAIEATAQAVEHSISSEQVSTLAISIEPSDGLMYRGMVVYNHRHGKLLEHLGDIPTMRQLIVDTGGEVDTLVFNTIPKQYTREELDMQAQALDLLRAGLASADLSRIGQAATLSARVNQRLLPKAHFADVVGMAQTFGASGVVCAHSGTILSLLFAPENTCGPEQAQAELSRRGYPVLLTHSITSW